MIEKHNQRERLFADDDLGEETGTGMIKGSHMMK